MLQLKKISMNLALIVSLASFAGVNSATAQSIDIPLPTEDPQIKAVVEDIRVNVDVKNVMLQTRDKIMVEQAKRLPLVRPMGDAISEVISARVRQETRDKTRRTQMAAMMDVANPEGIPMFIAPKFD